MGVGIKNCGSFAIPFAKLAIEQKYKKMERLAKLRTDTQTHRHKDTYTDAPDPSNSPFANPCSTHAHARKVVRHWGRLD